MQRPAFEIVKKCGGKKKHLVLLFSSYLFASRLFCELMTLNGSCRGKKVMFLGSRQKKTRQIFATIKQASELMRG